MWMMNKRDSYLTTEVRQKVFGHIRDNARAKNIHIDSMNGHVDHVHCLVSLGTDQTIEKIMQLIKAESSFWINKSDLGKTKFGWQDEYFAVSVSEANVPAVRKYIVNQEKLTSCSVAYLSPPLAGIDLTLQCNISSAEVVTGIDHVCGA